MLSYSLSEYIIGIHYLIVALYYISNVKMATYEDQSRKTNDKFKKDARQTLSYNEEQIHKYDRWVTLCLYNYVMLKSVVSFILEFFSLKQNSKLFSYGTVSIKLDECMNKAIRLFNEHCLKATERAFQGMLDWIRVPYKKLSEQVTEIEKE